MIAAGECGFIVPMPQIIIIADDLTGAADTGAVFAQAGLAPYQPAPHQKRGSKERVGTGLATLIALSRAAEPPECDVLAVSTASRELPRDEAVERVREACTRWAAQGAAWIYKKMDSTLRGHPAAELAAVMDVLGIERALVAPAFPAQGRTTVGGRQLVNGAPVDQTDFGRDVPCSDLAALFRKEAGRREVRLIGRESMPPKRGILVADAETDEDLMTMARAAAESGIRLFCGSAGLAKALAATLPLEPGRPAPMPPASPPGPILVVVGSRHASTGRQVACARHRGVIVVRPERRFLAGEDDAMEGLVREIADPLAAGRDVIVTTADTGDSPLGAEGVAARLGLAVREVLSRAHIVGGVVLTGGDIAAAVCAALEAFAIRLRGEVRAGMPWGILIAGAWPGLRIVTKAGGFGDEDALIAAIGYLRLKA